MMNTESGECFKTSQRQLKTRISREIMNATGTQNTGEEFTKKCSVRLQRILFKGTVSSTDEGVHGKKAEDDKNDNTPNVLKRDQLESGLALLNSLDFQNTSEKTQCSFCLIKFRYASQLKFHMVDNHLATILSSLRDSKSTSVDSKELLTLENPFSCPYCSDRYWGEKYINYHMLNQHHDKLCKDLKDQLCELPSASTSSSGSGETPTPSGLASLGIPKSTGIKCGTCGKLIRNRYNLKRHTRMHTGEKPYKCNFCSHSFETDARLQNHVVMYHLGDTLNDFKGKEMSTACFDKTVASLVEKNIRKIPRFKRYACGICKKRYTKLVACKFHVITNHRQAMVSKLFAYTPKKKSPLNTPKMRSLFRKSSEPSTPKGASPISKKKVIS